MFLPHFKSCKQVLIAVFITLGIGLSSAGTWAKTLHIANGGEPASMDPHYVSGVWENDIVIAMFKGLMVHGADGKAVLGAAESYTVSDDGKVYTFRLRDHTWSDGVPVTAQDFVFAFRRILTPETAAQYAYLLYPIKGAEAVNTGKVPSETLGVKALDDRTLQIELTNPTPYFLEQLPHYTAYPVPKHVVEKYGKKWVKPDNIVVNGPYVLKEWIPNTVIRLEKNDRYHDHGNVDIDTLVFHTQDDMYALQKRFRAGEIDVQRAFEADQAEWLKKNMPNETKIAPYLGIYYYAFNTRKPPFDDVRVRNALSMAINREAIVNRVLKTGEITAYSFVPPGIANYGEPVYVSWKSLTQKERMAKAKGLLAQAGYGPDNPLKVTIRYNTYESHKRVAIAIADMWKTLGVQTELYNTEVKVHYADLKQGDFLVGRAGWIGDYNDPQNFLSLLETRTGANNYGQYGNPEFDRLMMEAEVESNIKKRAAIMAKAEAIMLEEQPVAPIYYYVSKNLVSRKVKGWVSNTRDIHPWHYLSLVE